MGEFNEDLGNDVLAKEVQNALFDPANVNQALQVEETRPQFELEPNELTLADEVKIEENGGVTAFQSPNVGSGLIGVETDGANVDSRARLETAEELDYVSGLKAEGGIRTRIINPGSAIYRWGIGADGRDTQVYWEYNAATDTHAAVVHNQNGRTVIPSDKWDTDKLVSSSELAVSNTPGYYYGYGAYDGSYPQLGTEPDATVATIDKIRYLWYGNGIIVFMRDAVDNSGRQLPRPVCAFVPTEEPALEQPNHPVFAEVDNNGTADLSVMSIGGRQGTRIGASDPQLKPIGHIVTSPPQAPTGDWVNIALMVRADGFEGIPLGVRNVSVVGNDQPIDIEVRGRATPDGAKSYGDGPNRDRPQGETSRINVEDTDPSTTAPGFLRAEDQIGTTSGGRGNIGPDVAGIRSPGTSFVRKEPTLVRYRSLGDSATTPDAVIITAETTA